MFGILEAVAVPAPGIFSSYDELFADLRSRMDKEGFKVVKSRSHRARLGGADVPGNDIVRCDLVCDRGGRPYKCMATKHKTSTKKTDCPWKAKAVNRKAVGGWELTLICDEHNHEPDMHQPESPLDMSDHSPAAADDVDDDDEMLPDGTDAVTAMPDAAMELGTDALTQFKNEYLQMPEHERMQHLANLQLRIAALYMIQNEETQRRQRQDTRGQRSPVVEANRQAKPKRPKRQRRTALEAVQSEELAHLEEPPMPPMPQDHDHLANSLMEGSAFQLQHAAGDVSMENMVMPQFHEYQPRKR